MNRDHDAARTTVIVGAGLFGLTAALELVERGRRVTVLEAGDVPAEDAASNDVSKVVRADYPDPFYARLALAAIEGWRTWNAEFGETLFHEDGVLFLTSQPVADDSFEAQSQRAVDALGVPTVPRDSRTIAAHHPAWNAARFVDGYFDPIGGWADAARVVRRLAARARERGVALHAHTPVRALEVRGDRVRGVCTAGRLWPAEQVLVAAGAWSARLVPELAARVTVRAMPVILLAPDEAAPFAAPAFPCWAADVTQTGYYGLPALADGRVKIAHHGAGLVIDPDASRALAADAPEVARLRAFLQLALPALADAPVATSRRCAYTDTDDGDFVIDAVPGRPGLYVASGGSGHAFKFAPVLGTLVADALEGRPTARFAWERRTAGHADGSRAEAPPD